MGCRQSTLLVASRIDDSIHAMLEHDRKMAAKRGEPVGTYVPRRMHPMLKPVCCSEEDDNTTTGEESLNAPSHSDEHSPQDIVETEQILFHTKHHTNTIDKRDLEALQSSYNRKEVHSQ